MNLLYLANVVVAEVGEDYYWHWTHDQEIGKALVAACATIVAALIAIIGVALTARKTTQQMELSKQGTPPELTRYKEWLEASEKYKEFVGPTNFYISAKDSAEYQEIESSRKAALERAVWERKVISACPDIRIQKRILNIPYAMSVAEKIDFFTLWPWTKSRLVKILENVFGILLVGWTFVVVIDCCLNPPSWQKIVINFLSFFFFAYIFSAILTLYAMDSGEVDAEYYFIRIRKTEPGLKAAETSESFSKYVANSRRLRFSYANIEYRDWIYYPGLSFQEKPILRFFVPVVLFIFCLFPVYWILCLISRCRYGSWKRYGSYRPEVFESGVENPVNEELSAQDESALGMESEESVELESEGKN